MVRPKDFNIKFQSEFSKRSLPRVHYSLQIRDESSSTIPLLKQMPIPFQIMDKGLRNMALEGSQLEGKLRVAMTLEHLAGGLRQFCTVVKHRDDALGSSRDYLYLKHHQPPESLPPPSSPSTEVTQEDRLNRGQGKHLSLDIHSVTQEPRHTSQDQL